jgi:hypothetical protein
MITYFIYHFRVVGVILLLNVYTPAEDKDDDTRDRFYEKLECVVDQFHRYHMKILVDFSAKVRWRTFQSNNKK